VIDENKALNEVMKTMTALRVRELGPPPEASSHEPRRRRRHAAASRAALS
jgi:hypothetical protein